jgi:prepilin-type N-terminal cleavage/methylation domain-containing protein
MITLNGGRGGAPGGRSAHSRPELAGFTLVELLVVIGIIGALAALLLSTIPRAWSQAQFVNCASNLRSQVQAHLAYAQVYRRAKPPLFRPPPALHVEFASPNIRWDGEPIGQGLLVPKFLTLDVLFDPSEALTDDVERDRIKWDSSPESGSSYIYFWRNPPYSMPPDGQWAQGVTFERESRAPWQALVMDVNGRHDFSGPFKGRKMINHPRLKRFNVGYVDGQVRSFGIDEFSIVGQGSERDVLIFVQDAGSRY